MAGMPTEEEVRDFESGKKPWPCTTTPSLRCKCVIQPTKGVVPSELGYGYYCGNIYGEYWEGRTCDWEWFEGRYELMLQLGRTKEPWKSRDTLNRKLKIRKDYQVTLPLESFLSGPVLQDLRREYGKKTAEKATLDDCIVYWRRNRSKYPWPLTDRELLANYEKKEEEEEMERQRLREERAKKGFTVDPEAKYPKEMEKMEELAQEAQMEAMQALVADLPHKVPNVEKDVPSASTEVLGVRATQMEAMKALVGDLPAQDNQSDRKGKAVDIPNCVGNEDDDWGEDELLADCDSD
ncbi:hypothetical protein PVAP13_4KG398105 [Panicum virgatum]|uniref:Uncharacterized protein n=1 Tax=Panicum virgatum TaxID=38727 RepID=A0A8T0TP43_PANVG|nr:hypothetical protein PVAP13_4KG398105 [Panicum virgatum]